MKILILLGGYLPASGYGGPVTSISNLVHHLGTEYEFFVIASNHDFCKKEPLEGIRPGWNPVGNAKVLYLQDKEFNRTRMEQIMDELHPDLLYMSSIFAHRLNYPAQAAARRKGIPVILAPRGELDENALRRSALKKRIYSGLMRHLGTYRRMYFHTTCEVESVAVENRLHVNKDRIFLIQNLPAGQQRKEDPHKQPQTLRIMCCSRILPNKNQLLAIKAVNQLPFPVSCDFYGPVENAEYWDECKRVMIAAPSNVHFRYGGVLRSDQVGKELLRHDCFLLPTAFENYGHAISEAMLHDCPPVISRGTTPWDWIAEAGCGFTASLEQPEEFTDALCEIGEMGQEAYCSLLERLRCSCEERLRTEDLKNGYRELFERAASH